MSKMYLVSDEELATVHRLLEEYHCGLVERTAVQEAQAACRARVVPEWATHFAAPEEAYLADDFILLAGRNEEIKR